MIANTPTPNFCHWGGGGAILWKNEQIRIPPHFSFAIMGGGYIVLGWGAIMGKTRKFNSIIPLPHMRFFTCTIFFSTLYSYDEIGIWSNNSNLKILGFQTKFCSLPVFHPLIKLQNQIVDQIGKRANWFSGKSKRAY